MKITRVEVVRRDPILLPAPWMPAWRQPGGEAVTSFRFSFYKISTDEGMIGIGPYTGANPEILLGTDPHYVEQFYDQHCSANPVAGIAGLEIALWDIIGKAANLPIHKLLGACHDRIPVYAATSRLLKAEQHVQQVKDLITLGFRAVKIRLHRPSPREDIAVVDAVREAVGDRILILADANQNHIAPGYSVWSRETALEVGRQLERLNVYFLEEPLPESDLDGLGELAASLRIPIAGGEQIQSPYGFKEIVMRDSYDILQPDVILSGSMGITGLRKTATFADYFGKPVIPHVLSGGKFPFTLAATLQAMATVRNCPMVEFPYDPPFLTVETCQAGIKDPIWIDEEGFVKIPDKPGLGIEPKD